MTNSITEQNNNAAAQSNLQDDDYKLLQKRADESFERALKISRSGLYFFVIPIILLPLLSIFAVIFNKENIAKINTEIINAAITNITVTSIICGVLLEIVALTVFYFYGRTLSQLDTNQRFLLAGSMCERLKDDFKQRAQLKIIESLIEHEAEDQEQSNKTIANTEIKISAEKTPKIKT
jgi:Na+/H+ antiporter NhaC